MEIFAIRFLKGNKLYSAFPIISADALYLSIHICINIYFLQFLFLQIFPSDLQKNGQLQKVLVIWYIRQEIDSQGRLTSMTTSGFSIGATLDFGLAKPFS